VSASNSALRLAYSASVITAGAHVVRLGNVFVTPPLQSIAPEMKAASHSSLRPAP